MSRGAPQEEASWQTTATVMLAVSAAVFLIQRFVFMFLDPIFEFCIFHLSALVAVAIYLRTQKGSNQSGLTHKG